MPSVGGWRTCGSARRWRPTRVLERKGAVVAYITTKGFRDVPFIQRGNRKFHYDMSWVKPKPLVKRRHCFELTERIDAHGRVITPLDEAEVRRVAAAIRAIPRSRRWRSACCSPTSIRRTSCAVQEILRRSCRTGACSISYAVLPKWKEYERASTTIADAYLKPIVSRQLLAMRGRLNEAGITAPAVIIKSNGGEMTLEAAAEAPVQMVLSGPTGGVIASRFVAEQLGIDHLVTIDMGGTSTDVLDGDRQEGELHHRVRDRVGRADPGADDRHPHRSAPAAARSPGSTRAACCRSGPQSAGAKPGPACYGRGGTEATVTDAQPGARAHQSRLTSSAAA